MAAVQGADIHVTLKPRAVIHLLVKKKNNYCNNPGSECMCVVVSCSGITHVVGT